MSVSVIFCAFDVVAITTLLYPHVNVTDIQLQEKGMCICMNQQQNSQTLKALHGNDPSDLGALSKEAI